jgi:hypothetical protein
MSQAASSSAVPMSEGEIRSLVETGRVREARQRLGELRRQGMTASWMGAWEAALALGKVESLASRGPGGTEESMAWLRAHGHEHRGCWVALRRGDLLGSDPSRTALHADLGRRGLLGEALFAWIDAETR